MLFYHGTSNRKIEDFKFFNRPGKKDFGRGVYLTTNFEQAKDWSCKRSTEGAIYEFNIEISNVEHLQLSNSEDLYYVLYLCRLGMERIANDEIDGYGEADIISGLMLDGKIKGFKNLAKKFNDGEITYNEFSKKIKLYDDAHNQACIKTELALNMLNRGMKKRYLTRKSGKTIIIEKEETIEK